jgi:hypothetical protein
MLSHRLGITKEIMSRVPHALDMEYQDKYQFEHGLGEPILSLEHLHFVSNNIINHLVLVL